LCKRAYEDRRVWSSYCKLNKNKRRHNSK